MPGIFEKNFHLRFIALQFFVVALIFVFCFVALLFLGIRSLTPFFYLFLNLNNDFSLFKINNFTSLYTGLQDFFVFSHKVNRVPLQMKERSNPLVVNSKKKKVLILFNRFRRYSINDHAKMPQLLKILKTFYYANHYSRIFLHFDHERSAITLFQVLNFVRLVETCLESIKSFYDAYTSTTYVKKSIVKYFAKRLFDSFKFFASKFVTALLLSTKKNGKY